jgi:hypothetical protein
MSETRYWITIERLAELHGISVRTAWRVVAREGLTTQKQTIPGELREMEVERCRVDGVAELHALKIEEGIFAYGYRVAAQ